MKKLLSFPPLSFAVETAQLFMQVGAPRWAAALSYFLTLTLFPLLVCVNYLIGLFHLDLEHLLSSLDQLLPAGALLVMTDYLRYVSASQSPALLWASLITILVSASAGLRTLLAAMDSLHSRHSVPVLRRVLTSVALSALFLLTVYLSVVVIFTGEWFFWLLEEHLPRGLAELIPPLSGLWQWMRYLLLFCFVLLLVLIIYRAGTPKRAMRTRIVLLSSVLAALAMVAASVLFSGFIGMSSRYALVYGSLASLIILLVWLYLCGNILLLGAVVGRVLEERMRGK
ncbi:YihY/virulence factor BrkB family protein [Pseudoflavonifractor sp. 60]|uniref:YihY/virulence factor BrkB family protein n=1 Tax=Pseudoflavonifractor sp. 60 TaxID=2304576 RepID=UPI00157F7607|nr:YihY/virulence factor BrkB family protein [Pseudoflavonifractor sp. 60]NBI66457.1 YihY/virulence factor BrkB family protein [Pseudoflavonifractor sp. 60]